MNARFWRKRGALVTFLVAGTGAVLAEHYMRPALQRKMRVR